MVNNDKKSQQIALIMLGRGGAQCIKELDNLYEKKKDTHIQAFLRAITPCNAECINNIHNIRIRNIIIATS